MHDPFLSRITNVGSFSEFEKRKEIRYYNKTQMQDYWTDHFKLSELRQMKIKQDQAPNRPSIFDGKYTFSILE
jgi:hypothetical protein